MELYNASAHAVKSVDSQLRVGGPATAQLEHVADFAKACTDGNIPYDFVSTHHYPSDPQCQCLTTLSRHTLPAENLLEDADGLLRPPENSIWGMK